MSTLTLLDGVTADTVGPATSFEPPLEWPLKCSFAVWGGDFGGGNVVLEQTPDGGTNWIQVGASESSDNQVAVELYHDGDVRAVLGASTTPAPVYAALHNVGARSVG